MREGTGEVETSGCPRIRIRVRVTGVIYGKDTINPSSGPFKMVSMRSGKSQMRSSPSLKGFLNVAFEIVPVNFASKNLLKIETKPKEILTLASVFMA